MIRVLLVDDQALVRTGFRMILQGEPDIDVVGEAGDGAHAVELVQRRSPDVVLMDLRMPVVDGIEATRRVRDLPGGGPRVLVLTTFDDDRHVLGALRAGASGFLLKDVTADDLVAAIRVIATGDALLDPTVTRRLIERFAGEPEPDPALRARLGDLTAREGEVLALVARGLSNAEIAAELIIGEATVKSHVAAVLAKLGARDRVQAVVLAYEGGLVTPGAGQRRDA